MHLLYFVQYFPPEKASGLPLVTDMLSGFAEYGWDVDVYVPTPTRGVSEETRKDYAKNRRKEILCDGRLTIHRMPLYRERNRMSQRIVRYCLFSLQCLVRGLTVPADAIFTGGGPPTQGIVGGLIHKATKKKFIFNPQDLFPDSLIIAGKVKEDSVIVRLGRKVERFAYENADAIITISKDMADMICSKITDSDKVNVVRNWVDIEKIKPKYMNNNTLFEKFDLPRDAFYVTYAGNIGMIQGIETIVGAAELLQEENNIVFVLFGNGSEEENIKQIIADKNLNNIKMFPLQPPENVPEVYSLGDVSIISCKPGTGKIGMPSKTWTIMATGTAIIGAFDSDGELDETLRVAKCGYCVGAGSAQKLAEAIVDMYRDQNMCREMGENARAYAEQHLDKESAVGQYIKIIEETVHEL